MLRIALLFILALSTPTLAQDWSQTHELVRRSLVFLEVDGFDTEGKLLKKTATGVMINDSGLILTVKHLFVLDDNPVPEGTIIWARVSGKFGNPVPVRHVPINLGVDLALWQMPDTGARFHPVCLQWNEINEGTAIGSSGFPAAIDHFHKEAKLDSKFAAPTRPLTWRTSIPFNKGQSGSPIYLRNGQVVGIAIGEAGELTNGLSYFYPLSTIKGQVEGLSSCASAAQSGVIKDELSATEKACIKENYDARITRTFSRSGSVRCPGGGCLLQSSDCNLRSTTLAHHTIGRYRIDEYQYMPTAENDASNGQLQLERDRLGVKSVSILLRCHPSSRPGAGGGWSSGKLSGTERHTNPRELMNEIRVECGVPPL